VDNVVTYVCAKLRNEKALADRKCEKNNSKHSNKNKNNVCFQVIVENEVAYFL